METSEIWFDAINQLIPKISKRTYDNLQQEVNTLQENENTLKTENSQLMDLMDQIKKDNQSLEENNKQLELQVKNLKEKLSKKENKDNTNDVNKINEKEKEKEVNNFNGIKFVVNRKKNKNKNNANENENENIKLYNINEKNNIKNNINNNELKEISPKKIEDNPNQNLNNDTYGRIIEKLDNLTNQIETNHKVSESRIIDTLNKGIESSTSSQKKYIDYQNKIDEQTRCLNQIQFDLKIVSKDVPASISSIENSIKQHFTTNNNKQWSKLTNISKSIEKLEKNQEKTLNAINQTINLGNLGGYQKITEQEQEWHEELFVSKIIKEMDVSFFFFLF